MDNQTHAVFVKQELRYMTAMDSGLHAVNPKATQVDIETNLTESADAQVLADLYLEANEHPRVFSVQIEGLLTLDSFVSNPPSFIAEFPRYSMTGNRLTVTAASINYETGITTLEIRG